MQPRGLEVVMSSPASYPRAAGPAGQTAGRATCGARALVAPGALLKPVSRPDVAALAQRRSEAPSGVPTSPERGERRLRHMQERQGPHGGRAAGVRSGGAGWPASRSDLERGTQARRQGWEQVGSHPSRGLGGASRIACSPLRYKRVLPRQCGIHLGGFPVHACDREAQAPDSLTSQPMV